MARALRAVDHDAQSAKELGHLRLSDVQVLTRAADLGRILVSHNTKDVRLLHEAWLTWQERWDASAHPLAEHPGILLAPHLPIPDLLRIVREFADSDIIPTNRAFAWNPGDGWHEPKG